MKNITYSFLVLIILFNIALISVVIKTKDKYNKYVKDYTIYNDSLWSLRDNNRNLLLINRLLSKLQNDKILNTLLLDENGDTTKLIKLASETPKLIFKYSEINCETCIEEQFVLLKKITNKIGANNIIILAKYNSLRNLSKFIRINNIEYRVFNMLEKLSSNDLDIPYYFILDRSQLIKHPYIPLAHYTEPVLEYYSEISSKYFN